MSNRIGRIAHIIRDVVSDAISNRLSDPRIHRFTSVTRVEVTPNLQAAHVYVSIMGNEAEERRTMQGLSSALGMVQTLVARRLEIRQCPILKFHLDRGIKAALETFRELDRVRAEHGPERPPAPVGPPPGYPETDESTGP
jgi:ribosome-binding factor A